MNKYLFNHQGMYVQGRKRIKKEVIALAVAAAAILGIVWACNASTRIARYPKPANPLSVIRLDGTCWRIGKSSYECGSLEAIAKMEAYENSKKQVRTFTVTAYTSSIDETDSSPCIAANGQDICKLRERGDQTCATNTLRFGTKISVPDFGTCTVRDRTNRRFSGRLDLYFGSSAQKSKAFAFGRKEIIVSVMN